LPTVRGALQGAARRSGTGRSGTGRSGTGRSGTGRSGPVRLGAGWGGLAEDVGFQAEEPRARVDPELVREQAARLAPHGERLPPRRAGGDRRGRAPPPPPPPRGAPARGPAGARPGGGGVPGPRRGPRPPLDGVQAQLVEPGTGGDRPGLVEAGVRGTPPPAER